MSRSALILAAHGSHEEPSVNQRVAQCSADLAERGLFDVVTASFHQGDPSYATVLDRLKADEVTVVPVMTSAGYFSEVVLPRELSRNKRFSQMIIRWAAPVGTHPQIAGLVAQHVGDLMQSHELDPTATTLALIGHGTERHERSRQTTVKLADQLEQSGIASEVLFAFLEEEPHIEDVCARASNAAVIVIPFFIGAGPHALHDVPTRLGLALQENLTFPLCGRVGNRLLICDNAVGSYPEVVEVIAALAAEIQCPKSKG